MSYTIVTAQVLDPIGQRYANATYNVAFVNQNTDLGAKPPNLSGSPFQTELIGARCDSSGFLEIILADNTVVTPGPSQWRFSISSVPYSNPDAVYSFEWQGTIAGVTQDITTQLQAVAALLPTTGAGGAPGIQSINANNNPAQIIAGAGVATVSSAGGTTTINVPPAPPALVSINGDTTPAQQIVAGTGITIMQVPPGITVISLSGAAPVLVSISMNPSSVLGGATSTGTVLLTSAAPAGGALVTLSSSNPSVAQVPASVLVAAGATSATFTATTNAVTMNTAITISGTYGATHTASLQVTVTPPSQAVYGGVGQSGATGTITQSGTTVILSTGDVLGQLQTRAERVGDSWQFSPNNQVIYLLLLGGTHTFTDQNNAPLPFNAPITTSLGGTTMYLYQSTFPLSAPFTVKVAS